MRNLTRPRSLFSRIRKTFKSRLCRELCMHCTSVSVASHPDQKSKVVDEGEKSPNHGREGTFNCKRISGMNRNLTVLENNKEKSVL